MASFPNFSNSADTFSLAAASWANTGKPPAQAFRFDVPRDTTGFEPFLITPYQHGVCIEFAGLVECWTEMWSFHNNFRYGTVAVAPQVWFGDPLDMGGIMIQGNQVFHVENGIPVIDEWYSSIICQRFQETSHGDLRLIVRGAGDGFQFRIGAPNAETVACEIDANGIHVDGVNLVTKIEELETRIAALEGA